MRAEVQRVAADILVVGVEGLDYLGEREACVVEFGPASRCIVTATSFCEYADTKPRKTPKRFALDADRPLLPAYGRRGAACAKKAEIWNGKPDFLMRNQCWRTGCTLWRNPPLLESACLRGQGGLNNTCRGFGRRHPN